ncbi:helix-turn-helix domain-containing protein [Jannaschia sp. LMIT008]|uniref:helix-turn-helix domain-containing protein n=1 Tax=Jannaschia maritima TaxID=3032585 RepID=UPI002810ABBA|nr:helix-turn-helix domain-containing protein [Jannaschia sp. LMIT008]
MLADAPGPGAARSRRTRARILDATRACILERGLRDTTTVLVTERAGVSRGALLHHFPAKEDLLREALRDLLVREVAHMRGLAGDVTAGRLDFDGLIDRLWGRFSGPLYMISLEFVNAARTDAAILDVLRAVAPDFNEASRAIWDELVRVRLGRTSPRHGAAFTATLCLLRGMATQTIWRDDPEILDEALAFWKDAMRDLGITADRVDAVYG